MSRSQGHRKSQSTSALAVIAAGGPIPSGISSSRGTGSSSSKMSQSTSTSTSTSAATPRASRRHQSQHSQSRLGAVIEDDRYEHTEAGNQSPGIPGIDSDLAKLQRAMDERKASDGATAGERSRSRPPSGIDEVKAALNDIRSLRSSERRRLSALRKIERKLVQTCAQQSHADISISDLLKLDIHSALVSLLTRHSQTLSHRASRTHTTLSASDGVAHILKPELSSIVLTLQGLCLIDQRAKDELGQGWMLELIIDQLLVLRAQMAPEGERPIVYLMLDLLCCILVDSPANCRTFESLNGVEGVVRVLKGSGVAKEVRMKCIEFLYFYLLPEKTGEKESQPQRTSSSSSSSTTSSTSSQLYPPKTTPEDLTPLASPTTPSRRQKVQTPTQKQYDDLDITFVPQTPQKKPQPSLGFLTPSTRRVSGSSSVTTTPRSSIPPSPRRVPPSPSHQRLSSIDQDMEGGNFGLGLGLPRSSTAANLSARSEAKRDVTAIKLPETPRRKPSASDPFNNTANTTSTGTATTSSSGSSTVVPPSPRGMSRSSTQMNLPSSSPDLRRTPSIVRTDTSYTGSSTAMDDTPKSRPPKVRHSHTSGQLSALATDPPSGSGEGRSSKPRQSTSVSASHARASISMSSDTSRGPSPTTTTTSTSTSMPPPPVPKPTPRKGFPAGITKGLPSAVSSPNLNSPLGAARRIPSGRLADRPSSNLKEVRSVEEKKELLGQWLGNVDALVQGVEKVSFWGNVDKR